MPDYSGLQRGELFDFMRVLKAKKEKKSFLLRFAILVFAVYAAVALVNQQMQISEKKRQLADLKQQIKIQEIKNEDLKHSLSSGSGVSDEYIERVVREGLDYAKPGERVFVNIAGNETALTSRGGYYYCMQLEVGTILEGKVTGITKFGAFVELPEGKTGMVHISEVAPTFVKEIRDYVTENQMVKVKVLSISDDGKVSLSMKKAVPPPPRDNGPAVRHHAPRPFSPRPSGPRPAGRPGSYEWQANKKPEATSFEEMMSRFKQTSDEKMSDLKKGIDSKRGGFTKHGGPSR